MIRVYCYELDLEFKTLREAANATITALNLTYQQDVVAKKISRAMNTDEAAYGFHFCSPELKEMLIDFIEGDDFYV